MLTPQEIQSMQFTKAMRGYKEDEVENFINMVTLDFDKLIKENAKLKNDVAALEVQLEKYRGAQNEVEKTMQQAQILMDDIAKSAEKRADILVRNAELEAETKMREAKDKIQRLEDENQHLQKRFIDFRDKYKRMLENELERFETTTDEIFPDFTENKLEEILAEEPVASVETSTMTTAETIIMKDISEFAEIEGDDRRTIVLNMDDTIG